MELVYLWVEEYKNIHRQGFNFSPRFECKFYDKYDEDDNLENNCELIICDKEKGGCLDKDTKKCKPCQDNGYIKDFFGNNINITAIVGKNGSGKSSVLEVLSNKCDKPFLFIFIENENFNYYSHAIQEINTNYQNEKKTITTKKFSDIKMIKPIVAQSEENHNFYYTFKKLLSSNKELLTFLNKNFIFDKYQRYIELNILNNDNEIKNAKKNKFYFFSLKMIDDLLNNTTELRGFQDNPYKDAHVKFKELRKKVKKNITEEEYEKLLKSIKEIKSDFKDYYIEINIINNYTLDPNQSIYHTKALEFTDNHDESNIYLVKEDFINEKYPQYNYKNLSSGERKLLNIFTLLFNSLQSKEKKLILTIDEPDIYLHPNWQKEFIQLLFKNKHLLKNKHVILTTHSPFLLSDIPKQNIIFLDTDDEGNCKVVDGLNDKKETFGANIHTLLSNSFFMEDGLMGEFAKGKIESIRKFYNKVIKYKDNDKVKKAYKCFYEKKQKEFWDIQSIIGEPFLQTIVKNQLEEIEFILFEEKAQEIQIQRYIEEFGADKIREVLDNAQN